MRAATPARTRVLFLNTAQRPPLGADTWVHVQIMRELDRGTHEVHVACAVGDDDAPTPTYEMVSGIPDVHVVPVDFGAEFSHGSKIESARGAMAAAPGVLDLARLARYIRKHKIALIHTSDRPRDAVAAVLLAATTGAKSIIGVHTVPSDWMSRPLRWALRHADALVGVSEFVSRALVDTGHRPDRVHPVLNGIDIAAWTPGVGRADTRAEFGVAADDPLVLSVCRLFPEKGPAQLIRAAANLRPNHPGLKVVIAGIDVTPGKQFSAELHRLVDDLGMADAVVFAGRRPDISRLMAAADVFAMPSHEEPFGLVFAEAMAMELPVVGLDNGGTIEVVDHGDTGLLSPRGDIEALTANLATLLDDPDLRRKLGQRGRQVAFERFTTGRMARDVEALYRSLTGAAGTAVPAAPVGLARSPLASPFDVEACRRALDVDGYVVFRGLVSQEKLAELDRALAEEYRRAQAAGELFKGGGALTGHLNCYPGEAARFVLDELTEAGVVDLVRAVRPDIVDEVRATLNYNLPGSVAQHYHADGLYLEEFLICNVAVVDTDIANGAIDLLPGTQREFHPFWRYALGRKYRLTTRIPMQRGDVLLRKSTTWHRGMPNQTAVPRPMMAVTFGELSAPPADPFNEHEGGIVYYPNWYSTGWRGQLRERTFKAAPVTYSAYRFARSLYGKKGYASF